MIDRDTKEWTTAYLQARVGYLPMRLPAKTLHDIAAAEADRIIRLSELPIPESWWAL